MTAPTPKVDAILDQAASGWLASLYRETLTAAHMGLLPDGEAGTLWSMMVGTCYRARAAGCTEEQMIAAFTAAKRAWEEPSTGGGARQPAVESGQDEPMTTPTETEAATARALLRSWAVNVGWAWPEHAATPPGVYEALGARLGVTAGMVREVFAGRERMPAGWAERWAR